MFGSTFSVDQHHITCHLRRALFHSATLLGIITIVSSLTSWTSFWNLYRLEHLCRYSVGQNGVLYSTYFHGIDLWYVVGIIPNNSNLHLLKFWIQFSYWLIHTMPRLKQKISTSEASVKVLLRRPFFRGEIFKCYFLYNCLHFDKLASSAWNGLQLDV